MLNNKTIPNLNATNFKAIETNALLSETRVQNFETLDWRTLKKKKKLQKLQSQNKDNKISHGRGSCWRTKWGLGWS